jgi:hypothetical protein
MAESYLNSEWVPNPYRDGTKMRRVFDLFADGSWHTPGEVVSLVKSGLSPFNNSANRRTATSFIRTLRGKFIVHTANGAYKLTGRRISW